MNLQYFPHFIRANYPELKDQTNEDLIIVGDAFKQYLLREFKDKRASLEKIWNIDGMTVVKNQMEPKPGFINGYHPLLLLNFAEFIKEVKEANEIIP